MGCCYGRATTASRVEILARVWGTNGEREVQEVDIISAVEFDKIGDHLATGDKENFSSGFHVEKRQSSLVLCWQRKELILASAWRATTASGVEILARVWGTNGEREVQEVDIISVVEFDKIGDHLATGDKENFSSGFHVEKRQSSLVLCWQRKELILASAWRC
ncbi:hypothetical protein F0562_025594 [Nyssa sinensis]|uniref:Uncharacterized protein n=1 Tax=Nyssa sinensis TaxID=561372 RepID=A0A5J5BAC5_9ASTE|nr:hypothetical protein F0562_025594 [Nyssa sinensis]